MYRDFGFDKMIYFSPFSIWAEEPIADVLLLDGYRFVLGIVGSMALLVILQMLRGRFHTMQTYLAKVGRKTFELYVFQDLLLVLLHPLFKHLDSQYLYANGVISFCVVLVLSLILTKLSDRYRYIGFLIGK